MASAKQSFEAELETDQIAFIRSMKNKYEIVKLSHYSAYSSKETYREEALELSLTLD